MNRPRRGAIRPSFLVGKGRAVLAATALLCGCRPERIDPMKRQERFNAYQANPFFDDGRELRPPVEGTVPRERRLGSAAFPSGRLPGGGYAAAIPVHLDRAALLKGRRHFEVTCATCHGVLGDGNSIPASKMSLRAAPSLFLYRERPPGFFYEVITEGWGLMPSYAAALGPEARWQIVGYLQALMLSQSARLDQAPAGVQSRLLKEAP